LRTSGAYRPNRLRRSSNTTKSSAFCKCDSWLLRRFAVFAAHDPVRSTASPDCRRPRPPSQGKRIGRLGVASRRTCHHTAIIHRRACPTISLVCLRFGPPVARYRTTFGEISNHALPRGRRYLRNRTLAVY
jgi:hypothetical protein